MGKNIARLGSTLAERMKKSAQKTLPTVVEFGTINQNLSLSVDGLDRAIPKGSYMVNLMLAGSSSYKTSSISIDGKEHSHAMPSGFRPLKKGDRVMVIWNGFEPVVIAIIVNS